MNSHSEENNSLRRDGNKRKVLWKVCVLALAVFLCPTGEERRDRGGGGGVSLGTGPAC